MPTRAFPLLALVATSACAAVPPPSPAGPPASFAVSTQVITPTSEASEPELLARGQRALADLRFKDAADAFELLLAAGPTESNQPVVLYGLGTAYEGLGDRARAAPRYRELARRFPGGTHARAALLRAVELHAFLEDWAALGTAGDELLARKDLAALDRALGLGARGLARIEAGDEQGAQHDVQGGLDLIEEARIGDSGGRTPVAVSQLRFALAEIRRTRSERITFQPLDPEAFGGQLEARCQGLLDAQNAYTAAMHGVDPHWSAMAGFRVGDMYRTLHRDVMAVPEPRLKGERERQLFYAAMHLRYRILLDKGLRMMNGTLDLAASTKDSSAWVQRAEAAKRDIEATLATEKATIAGYPFTEAEMLRALELLVAKAAAKPRDPRSGR